MIWLFIGIGIYLAIGCFMLIIFITNRMSGFTFWNVIGVVVGWLPIGIYFWIKNKIENK